MVLRTGCELELSILASKLCLHTTIGWSEEYIRAGYPAFCEGLAGKLLQLSWLVLQINYHGLDLASSYACTQAKLFCGIIRAHYPAYIYGRLTGISLIAN